jgi:hypothetical protein
VVADTKGGIGWASLVATAFLFVLAMLALAPFAGSGIFEINIDYWGREVAAAGLVFGLSCWAMVVVSGFGGSILHSLLLSATIAFLIGLLGNRIPIGSPGRGLDGFGWPFPNILFDKGRDYPGPLGLLANPLLCASLAALLVLPSAVILRNRIKRPNDHIQSPPPVPTSRP